MAINIVGHMGGDLTGDDSSTSTFPHRSVGWFPMTILNRPREFFVGRRIPAANGSVDLQIHRAGADSARYKAFPSLLEAMLYAAELNRTDYPTSVLV